ncbi:alpha/beta hydrolase [Hahella ganghwensis]|uniref:alpha/beta hydrolase n=1 Tax=Hahella ganghwensis TaxID=286420 RepID=UPI000380AB33|nr:alpha/beta fold hydrolase [Hahella ganghwensis]
MKEQLVSADLLQNGLVEDVYLIYPNNSDDSSVALAVTHLSRADRASATPVVLIHGQFSNRSVWFDLGGDGLARHLVERGYDVWMPEMRGHGFSPVNQRYRNNSLVDYVDFDFPALQSYLSTRIDSPCIWVAYGLSGVALTLALAKGTLSQNLVEGVVLLGLDDPRGAWRKGALIRALQWRDRKRGFIPGGKDDGATESEPYGVIHGQLNPLKRMSIFTSRKQVREFTGGLAQLEVPLLMCSGPEEEGKLITSHKIFQHWGGSDKDFMRYSNAVDELSMVKSSHARHHVWKDIDKWLNRSEKSESDLEQSA